MLMNRNLFKYNKGKNIYRPKCKRWASCYLIKERSDVTVAWPNLSSEAKERTNELLLNWNGLDVVFFFFFIRKPFFLPEPQSS